MITEQDSGAFIRFCETAEQIGATTKRLEKAAYLGAYFASLSDEDLTRAARYFAGYAFSLRDQRTTNVGGAALLTAIEAVSGADPNHLRERVVVLGDGGDATAEVFTASPQAALPATLTLSEIADLLETLAATSGSKRKVEIVTAALRRATPLEGKYLVKLLVGDLRIGLKEGAVEDGVARLAGADVGSVQWANMLTGDIGETARLARHGRLGDATMHLFHPLKFMLATAAVDADEVTRQMPNGFAIEDKFDGIRAQAHIEAVTEVGGTVGSGSDAAGTVHGEVRDGRRVALFSRTLDEITESFPDLVESLADVVPPEVPSTGDPTPTAGDPPSGILLDGEIVPVRGDTILPFLELQKRLGRKTLPEELRASVPVAFVAYDILYANGKILLNEPFTVRRAILEALLPLDGPVRRAASEIVTDTAGLDAAFDAARARGNEGLMVKDPASPYRPGRRGRDWLKIKRALATLDVVVTAVEVGNGRRSKFLSDYTFAVRASETDPTLLNVGKAYSGLTDAEIEELSEWFRAHTVQEFAHGKVRVVEPKIVLEVTFDRVQASARHKGGYALRFPRILRRRDDKPVSEIDTIDAVRRLAEEGDGVGGAEDDTP